MKTPEEKIKVIIQAIRDYHFALDTHQHAGVAERAAFDKITGIMGMPWERGAEQLRRVHAEDK